jgi:hypothetical protein
MPHNVHIVVAVIITRGEAQEVVLEYSSELIIILHNPLMRGTSLA